MVWPLSLQDCVQAFNAEAPRGLAGDCRITGITTDSRSVQPQDLFLALKGERFDGTDFISAALDHGAVAAIVSLENQDRIPKNLQDRCCWVPDTTESFRTFAQFFRRRLPCPVIAIGGSNGKTTVKEMLFALLSSGGRKVTRTEKSQNGFLGISMTLCQRGHTSDNPPQFILVEIGIDTVGAMAQHVAVVQPQHVVLTCLGPEHLAGLKNWETAVAEELKLFQLGEHPAPLRIWQFHEEQLWPYGDRCQAGDTCVVNQDHPPGWDVQAVPCSLFLFKTQLKTTTSDVQWSWSKSPQNPMCQGQFGVPLPGAHNAANGALAWAVALSLGLPVLQLQQGWEQFEPPDMRSRIVSLSKNMILYEDCYNASPHSMVSALHTLQQEAWVGKRKFLVLGDMLDLGEQSQDWHLKLVPEVLKVSFGHLCFYGKAMYDVYQACLSMSKVLLHQAVLVHHLDDQHNPQQFLEFWDDAQPPEIVLVKGSRGMGLERVVTGLMHRFSKV